MSKTAKNKPYRLTSTFYRRFKIRKDNPANEKYCLKESDTGRPSYSQITNNFSEQLNEPVINMEMIKSIGENVQAESEWVSETLRNEIRVWAIENKITLNSVTKLLKILKRHGNTELPDDGRTLLQTPDKLKIIPMEDGFF